MDSIFKLIDSLFLNNHMCIINIYHRKRWIILFLISSISWLSLLCIAERIWIEQVYFYQFVFDAVCASPQKKGQAWPVKLTMRSRPIAKELKSLQRPSRPSGPYGTTYINPSGTRFGPQIPSRDSSDQFRVVQT